jgi:hypothetical protein
VLTGALGMGFEWLNNVLLAVLMVFYSNMNGIFCLGLASAITGQFHIFHNIESLAKWPIKNNHTKIQRCNENEFIKI